MAYGGIEDELKKIPGIGPATAKAIMRQVEEYQQGKRRKVDLTTGPLKNQGVGSMRQVASVLRRFGIPVLEPRTGNPTSGVSGSSSRREASRRLKRLISEAVNKRNLSEAIRELERIEARIARGEFDGVIGPGTERELLERIDYHRQRLEGKRGHRMEEAQQKRFKHWKRDIRERLRKLDPQAPNARQELLDIEADIDKHAGTFPEGELERLSRKVQRKRNVVDHGYTQGMFFSNLTGAAGGVTYNDFVLTIAGTFFWTLFFYVAWFGGSLALFIAMMVGVYVVLTVIGAIFGYHSERSEYGPGGSPS